MLNASVAECFLFSRWGKLKDGSDYLPVNVRLIITLPSLSLVSEMTGWAGFAKGSLVAPLTGSHGPQALCDFL